MLSPRIPLTRAITFTALTVLFASPLAAPALADIVPATAYRLLGVVANGTNDSLVDTDLGPFSDSLLVTATEPGLICPILDWSAAAEQTSSMSASTVIAAGSVDISFPPDGCAQGSGSSASTSAAQRFILDGPHDVVLTGVAENVEVTLEEFGGAATVYFQRLPGDPAGPIAFAQELPAATYTLVVAAEADWNSTPFTQASFDVQLDATPTAAPVPAAGVGAILVMTLGLGAAGLAQLRRKPPYA